MNSKTPRLLMATSYLAAVAMQELVRYQGRWFRAKISGGKEEICF